jgi:hypothetical protein
MCRESNPAFLQNTRLPFVFAGGIRARYDIGRRSRTRRTFEPSLVGWRDIRRLFYCEERASGVASASMLPAMP